jgi:hypothetical protein
MFLSLGDHEQLDVTIEKVAYIKSIDSRSTVGMKNEAM